MRWYIIIRLEYWKIISLLECTTNQTPYYRIKTWVEINDNTKAESCDAADQIKSNTTMKKPSLCDFSDAYIPVIVIISIIGPGYVAAAKKKKKKRKSGRKR